MRKVATSVLLVGLVCLASSQALAYTWEYYGGHKYALTETHGGSSDGFGTWDDCEAEAVIAGGHLVTINDTDENNELMIFFIDELIAQNFLWIGFNDVAEEGTWVWVSGEPVTFTSWYGSEPNNQSPGEDYGVLEQWLDPVQWNDWGPDKGDFYPIQGIIEIVPEPSAFVLLGLGALMLSTRRSRRKK